MTLLTNASDALGSTPGRITVSTSLVQADGETFEGMLAAAAPQSGPHVRLQVTDTGCGMDEQTRARMFDPFFSTKFTGRGLGLASTLGILRSHHGAVKVQSSPGQGTTIEALFPAAPEDAPLLPASDPSASAASDLDGMAGLGGRVLVIDDDPLVCAVLGDTLEREGFTPTTALDGEAGLEIFDNLDGVWQLVILDLTMPTMSGAETFHRLKQIAPHVPVVLMSGYSEPEALDHFAGEDLAGFLQKPFQPDEFRRVLVRAISAANASG
jgi:CheY-like chemotaxis protein